MNTYNSLTADERLMVWLTRNPQERTAFVLSEADLEPEPCGYCNGGTNPAWMCRSCHIIMTGE